MTERTILFLHTEAPTREALARERPPGRLVLATDEVAPEDVFYDEVVRLPPAEDVVGTLRALDRVPCDDVVVQTEHGLLAGSLFARHRGLAAPSPQAALLTTNKWLCREALRAAGVRVPRYALVETAEEVRRFADGDRPVVVKPVASTLGHLVTKVVTPAVAEDVVGRLLAELPRSPHVARCAAFARIAELDLGCDPTRQFLVEEFVEGPALETDGLVFGDEVDLFGVTEQVLSPPPTFFVEGYLLPVLRPAVEEASRTAIAALGLRDAGFSIEFRGDVLIEVNGRLGEDGGFPDLFRAALGRYPILKWLDRDAGRTTTSAAGHAIAYSNWYRDGVVRTVSADFPTVTALVAPGTRMFAPPDPRTAPHLAYALASHPAGPHAAYAQARAALGRVRIEVDARQCVS